MVRAGFPLARPHENSLSFAGFAPIEYINTQAYSNNCLGINNLPALSTPYTWLSAVSKAMTPTSKRQQVLDLLDKNDVLRPSDLVAEGLPKDYLYQLTQQGVIERVGRGLYRRPSGELSQWQSFVEVSKRVPAGVVCLLSALVFYGITTQNPFQVWLAIDRKAWRPNIDYPPLRFVTMSGPAMSEGVMTHKVQGTALKSATIKVFSLEKTIADCFKYRNKIGLDVAVEALREALRMRRFSLAELYRYAEICRVTQVIRPYVESMSAE